MSPPPASLVPPPPPSALLPRTDNNNNTKSDDAVLSGAAFLRRAASCGLVSVAVKAGSSQQAPFDLPRAPSASSVFSTSSSSSSALAPQVSAFLPIAGLPAPSGLVRALSGVQGLPPQVELRLYRSDGSGALSRALSSKKSLGKMASEAAEEAAAAATEAAAAAAAAAAPAAVAAAAASAPSSSSLPPPISAAAVARALSRGTSAEIAAALLGCRLSEEEDEEAGSPLSSSSSIKEKPTAGPDDDDGDDGDGEVDDDASSLPALFLLPPPAGADAPPEVAHLPPYSIRKAGVEKTAEARVFVTAAAGSGGGEEAGGGGGGAVVDVSPWHDVPLRASAAAAPCSSNPAASPSVNMVVEIPRGTSAKFEVATSEERTPIKQDKAKVKKNKIPAPAAADAAVAASAAAGGSSPAPAAAAAAASAPPPAPALLRHYALPISWNYGMLPRTFEDPKAGADEVYAAEETKIEEAGKGKATAAQVQRRVAAAVAREPRGRRAGDDAVSASSTVPAARDLKGDGDPLDAVEFSETAFPTGTVVPVRILGAFALIDEGELDWKILCLDANNDKLFALAAPAPAAAAPAAAAPAAAAAAAAATATAATLEGTTAPPPPPLSPLPILSLADLERARPGEVERVVQWFSTYKQLEGGEAGAVGLGGRVLGARRAADVVAEGERAYGRLRLASKQQQQQ